jgi:hypothetical protein
LRKKTNPLVSSDSEDSTNLEAMNDALTAIASDVEGADRAPTDGQRQAPNTRRIWIRLLRNGNPFAVQICPRSTQNCTQRASRRLPYRQPTSFTPKHPLIPTSVTPTPSLPTAERGTPLANNVGWDAIPAPPCMTMLGLHPSLLAKVVLMDGTRHATP